MLIEVSENVLKKALDKNDNDHEKALEIIRHLCLAIRKNSHLIHIPQLSFDSINSFAQFLNRAETKALALIYGKRRDLNAIATRVYIKMVISYDETSRRENGVIYLNPSTNSLVELYEECHLLTENLQDADFYRIVAKVVQKSKHLDTAVYQTNFFPMQGGGITIKDVYKLECLMGHHLCLAILDSDKKWPNCNESGNTAKKFEEEMRNIANPLLCDYYIMSRVSEIENLIPIDVLLRFSAPPQKAFLKNHYQVLPWCDIKKGLEYKILFDNTAYKEWKKEFPTEVDWATVDTLRASSKDKKDYEEKVKQQQFPVVYSPWGTQTLSSVLRPDRKHVGKYDLYSTDMTKLHPNQKSEWEEIGWRLFSWTCCFVKKIF